MHFDPAPQQMGVAHRVRTEQQAAQAGAAGRPRGRGILHLHPGQPDPQQATRQAAQQAEGAQGQLACTRRCTGRNCGSLPPRRRHGHGLRLFEQQGRESAVRFGGGRGLPGVAAIRHPLGPAAMQLEIQFAQHGVGVHGEVGTQAKLLRRRLTHIDRGPLRTGGQDTEQIDQQGAREQQGRPQRQAQPLEVLGARSEVGEPAHAGAQQQHGQQQHRGEPGRPSRPLRHQHLTRADSGSQPAQQQRHQRRRCRLWQQQGFERQDQQQT